METEQHEERRRPKMRWRNSVEACLRKRGLDENMMLDRGRRRDSSETVTVYKNKARRRMRERCVCAVITVLLCLRGSQTGYIHKEYH